jgi:hypothetical protein
VYYYHTTDTYTGLLVPEGIIHYYHTIVTYTGLLVPEGIIHYYHTIDTYTGLLVPECVLLSYDQYLYWTISPVQYRYRSYDSNTHSGTNSPV